MKRIRLLDEREGERLYEVDAGDLTISVLVIDEEGEEVEYFPADWQGLQPQSIDEARDFDWVRDSDFDLAY